MTEDNLLFGRNEVIAVLLFDGGNLGLWVEFEELRCEPFAIGVVGDQVENEGSESDGESSHE